MKSSSGSRLIHKSAVAAVIWAALFMSPGAIADWSERSPVATTPHFAFFSDPATNLHDALMQAGRDRKFGRTALFEGGEEQSCFEALAPSAQAGWKLAVDYYAEIISPASFNERRQYLLRMHLAGFDDQLQESRTQRYLNIARGFMTTARPAYEACRWVSQDAVNRAWIEKQLPLLNAHEAVIAKRLGDFYRESWPGSPIAVDIVETVSWSGANSFFWDPGGAHLLIANSYAGHAGLEIVFHEASHGFMLPGKTLPSALSAAASEAGVALPQDLWHVVLFYTTGETVRRVIEEAEGVDYTPMLEEIYTRSPWVQFRPAIESTWPAYLDSERSMDEAAADLVRALAAPPQAE